MKNDTKDAPNPSPLPSVEELTSYLEPTGFILTRESVIGPFEEETRSLIISSVNSIPRLLAANAELREALEGMLAGFEDCAMLSSQICAVKMARAALAKADELGKLSP